MSYDALNSPVLMFPNVSSNPWVTAKSGNSRIWQYNSADSLATVQGSGYFTNGGNQEGQLGMVVGDIVFVSVSDVLKTPTQYVSVVNSTTGVVTVASATT